MISVLAKFDLEPNSTTRRRADRRAFGGAIAAPAGPASAPSSAPTPTAVSGLSTIATAALALVAKFPNTTADVSPWNH